MIDYTEHSPSCPRYCRACNKLACSVSQRQAEVLRLARDAGRVQQQDCSPMTLRTIRMCENHRWLSKHMSHATSLFWTLTDVGRAALTYFDETYRFAHPAGKR